jgi:hypothetical protein
VASHLKLRLVGNAATSIAYQEAGHGLSGLKVDCIRCIYIGNKGSKLGPWEDR